MLGVHCEGLPATPLDGSDLRSWAVAELRSTSPWSLPSVLGELGRFDSSAWIGGVAVPAAVVVTARDRAIPPQRQRDLAALVRHAVVRESPSGHASLVLDRDDWQPIFLEAVAEVAGRSLAGQRRA